MNTVKVYMVRKPSDFEEVKTLCKKYTHEAEEVLIEETVNLPPTWYEEFCQRPLDNYIFLSGILVGILFSNFNNKLYLIFRLMCFFCFLNCVIF